MIFVIDSGIAGDIGGLACLKAGRKIEGEEKKCTNSFKSGGNILGQCALTR